MSDSIAYAIARSIRAERARAGLSQAQLSDRLGWSRQVLTAVEAGARRHHADELPELCKALDVSLADLLHGGDPEDIAALRLG